MPSYLFLRQSEQTTRQVTNQMPTPDTAELSSSDFIDRSHRQAADMRAELGAGLLLQKAEVSPKYLYDLLGS